MSNKDQNRTRDFDLKYMIEGQANLVEDYNETITILEAFSYLSVIAWHQNTPPGSPSNGDSYVIGPNPTGVWSEIQEDDIVIYKDAWIVRSPKIGMVLWDIAGSDQRVWNGTEWHESPSAASALSDLNQTITGPSIAEVQAITDKLDTLLNRLTTTRLILP